MNFITRKDRSWCRLPYRPNSGYMAEFPPVLLSWSLPQQKQFPVGGFLMQRDIDCNSGDRNVEGYSIRSPDGVRLLPGRGGSWIVPPMFRGRQQSHYVIRPSASLLRSCRPPPVPCKTSSIPYLMEGRKNELLFTRKYVLLSQMHLHAYHHDDGSSGPATRLSSLAGKGNGRSRIHSNSVQSESIYLK